MSKDETIKSSSSGIEATKEGVEEKVLKRYYFLYEKDDTRSDTASFIANDFREACNMFTKATNVSDKFIIDVYSQPQSPTATPKPEDGELYRWVKASERLPEDKNKLYIIKYGKYEIQYASLFVIKHKTDLKIPIEWLCKVPQEQGEQGWA